MDLRIFTEPQQGATYDELLAAATVAEEEGFDAFFRSDHYLTMGGDGLPGPTDAWITLAGLARDTQRIRLGTLVTSATFRLPGPLAIAVAQVDAMSGGRVELGLGAGWFGAEHTAYGIPYAGAHYQLSDSPALPKPVQSPVPVIVGGSGVRKTPALVARYASEYNTPFLLPEAVAEQNRLVSEACDATGRDPGRVKRTSAVVVCCGSDDAEVARRAASIGREVDELKANGVCGTPDEVAARLADYAAAGATTAYLQVLDLADLDHIRLIGREVAPKVA
jgi:alkanesulfonate monooxygenase SsuD/methylene tetrahydromethanopterin reductase-like flavin-dependent oxidoreductase (luciferase family)